MAEKLDKNSPGLPADLHVDHEKTNLVPFSILGTFVVVFESMLLAVDWLVLYIVVRMETSGSMLPTGHSVVPLN